MSEQTRTGASFGAVTLSDTADIAKKNGQYPRALYFGVGGTAAVVAPDGTVGTFIVAASQMLPVQAKRVNNTGSSTVASIVAVY